MTDQTPAPLAPLAQETPLAEAEAFSLDELFSRDPLDLTDDDLRKIVHELRARRSQWAQEEEAAQKEGRKVRSSVAKKPLSEEEKKAALASIDLDLDLNL